MLILLQCGDRSLVLDVANFFDLRAQAEALFQPLIDGDKELDLSYEFPATLAAEKGLSVPSSYLLGGGNLSPSRYERGEERSPLRTGSIGGESGAVASFTAFVRCPQSFATFLGVWQECIRPYLISSRQQLLPTLTVAQSEKMRVPTTAAGYSNTTSHSSYVYSSNTNRGGISPIGGNSLARGDDWASSRRVVASGTAGLILEERGTETSDTSAYVRVSAPTDESVAAPSRNKAARRNVPLPTSDLSSSSPASYSLASFSSPPSLNSPEHEVHLREREAKLRQNKAIISNVLTTPPPSPAYLRQNNTDNNNTTDNNNNGEQKRDRKGNSDLSAAVDDDVYIPPPSVAPFAAPSSRSPHSAAVVRERMRQSPADARSGRGGGREDSETFYSQSSSVRGLAPLTDNQRKAKELLSSFSPSIIMGNGINRENDVSAAGLPSEIRAVMRCGEASVVVPFNPLSPPTQKELLNAVRKAMIEKLHETQQALSARSPSRMRNGSGGGGGGVNEKPLTDDELFEMAALEALSVPDPNAVVFVLGMTLPGTADTEHSIADVDDDSDVRLLARAILAEGNDYSVQLVVESRAADDVEALALPNAFFFGEDVRSDFNNHTLGFNRTQASPSRSESRNASRNMSRIELSE